MLSIYNKIRDFIIVLNYDGDITFCNESFLRRLNYKSEDVLNLKIHKLLKFENENIKYECIEGKKRIKTLFFYSKFNEPVKINCQITIDYFNNEKSIFIIGEEADTNLYTTKMIEKIKFNENNNNLKNEKCDNMDLIKTLSDIGDSILNYTNADGLSIFMYENDKEGLVPFIKLNNANIYFENINFIQTNINTIYSQKYKTYLDKTYNKEKLKELLISDQICMDKLGYIGNYIIELSSEFIGFITLTYSDTNHPKCNYDEYMKYVSNQIAMIIKNVRLTNQIILEKKMRQYTERELEQYLSVSADLVSIVGTDGYLKKISPNWHKVLGWTEKELLSMHLKDIVHPEDMNSFNNENLLNVIDMEIIRKIIRFKHKEGHYICLEWSSKYISSEQIHVTAARDITSKLEIEKENKKLEEAVNSEIVKNEFFSNISHEFRTPINILIGTMQLMNKNIENNNIDTKSLKKCIKYIKQNSYRLLRLVNNLIDISKMDIGMYELRESNQNIINIIEDITLSVADYTKDNEINLVFDTNTEELITCCDPDKIERIMLNLLSNAIKYTPKNGYIKVNIYATDKEIKVCVKDTGIGIPKDKLEVIFDRFEQVDGSFNRKCEGSGIGLSLVKNLVELHGGTVNVKSKINEGSEFIFNIPIKLKEENTQDYDFDRKFKHVERCDIEFSDIYSV